MERTPPELTNAARRLRSEPTPQEWKLWQRLRTVRPRFTRQLVVDRYILDFACRNRRLAIELDGGQHAVQVSADKARTAYLEAEGRTLLRFSGTPRSIRTLMVSWQRSSLPSRVPRPTPNPSLEGILCETAGTDRVEVIHYAGWRVW